MVVCVVLCVILGSDAGCLKSDVGSLMSEV